MEKCLITRGLLPGALASLVAFCFARIFAEPALALTKAIASENGRDAAQAALNRAGGAGVSVAAV
jgi:hypothetical protein